MLKKQDENFCELLNDYLDDEDIMNKFECDCDVENNTTHKNSSYKISREDAISINDFVNNYLNIHTNADNLYHCGLKVLNSPYVIGISNDFAYKNPEYVKRGFILLVIDSHNKIGSYLNPFYLHDILRKQKIENKFKELKKKRLKGLKGASEFYRNYCSEYNTLENEKDSNDCFYKILVSQKKVKKLGKIRRYEKLGE